MSDKTQFGPLEDQIVKIFEKANPDFQAVKNLLELGADINASIDGDSGENMLSEILQGYWWVEYCQVYCNCERKGCDGCEYQPILEKPVGITVVEIVRFFIAHGFDVMRKEGRFGAECLRALLFSAFDANILIAAKILLDSGASNAVKANVLSDILNRISTECSYQGTVRNDYEAASLYEAYFQTLLAIEEHRAYQGVDLYTAALGKSVKRVLATTPEEGSVFFKLNLPTSKHKNSFKQTLYFEYEDGVLILTPYAEIWTDTILPNISLTDVSNLFPGIVGDTIRQIDFSHREIQKRKTIYGQPIVILKMNKGAKVVFSINFGEVAEAKNRVAYYSLQNNQRKTSS